MNRENADAGHPHELIKENSGYAFSDTLKTLVALGVLVLIGALIVMHKAPFSFGNGDHALFHAFGHWINQGEVFTRDFIHFRTPGPYYYYALVQHLFGETQLSTSMALLSEAHIGQVIASFVMALAVSKAFWKRSSLPLAFCIGALFLALPAIYQLRTAIPALALATYVYYLLAPRKSPTYLVVTGALLGLSFWFGQEVSLFLIISIGAAEISFHREKTVKLYLERIAALAVGIAATLLPVLFYFYAEGVSLQEFFYNTLYYAFFIQPKGMDSPFPDLHADTLIFYAWIWVYIACAFVFAIKKQLANPVAIVVFSYIGLRMISMLGRSDFLHLLFSISELFVLIPITLGLLLTKGQPLSTKALVQGIVSALLLGLIFLVGINGKSSALLAIPFLLIAYSYSDRVLAVFTAPGGSPHPLAGLFATALGTAAVVVLTLPYSVDNVRGTIGTFKATPSSVVLGTQVPAERKKEVDEVQAIIRREKADNIFSYPIRTEYYALVPKHGTRFVEFAPQTTPDDVRGAIADLKASRPKLVFRDLDQVSFLSPILHDLSDYVMSNYTPITIIEGYSHLEVLELKSAPTTIKRLFDNVYTLNTDHAHVTAGTRTYADGHTVLVIATNSGQGVFKLERESAQYVEAKIYPEPGAGTSGIVTATLDGNTIKQQVTTADGTVFIPLPAGSGQVTVTLESAEPGRSVLWEDPKIVTEKN
ncbi:hypothetical protein [Pseudomonas sp. RIT-To-2]|uniref:hypothetical protein n=1 Tax=Pseudomonas sp. RIT-To-2 TaxID=3462541 RepID=UPI002413201F